MSTPTEFVSWLGPNASQSSVKTPQEIAPIQECVELDSMAASLPGALEDTPEAVSPSPEVAVPVEQIKKLDEALEALSDQHRFTAEAYRLHVTQVEESMQILQSQRAELATLPGDIAAAHHAEAAAAAELGPAAAVVARLCVEQTELLSKLLKAALLLNKSKDDQRLAADDLAATDQSPADPTDMLGAYAYDASMSASGANQRAWLQDHLTTAPAAKLQQLIEKTLPEAHERIAEIKRSQAAARARAEQLRNHFSQLKILAGWKKDQATELTHISQGAELAMTTLGQSEKKF